MLPPPTTRQSSWPWPFAEAISPARPATASGSIPNWPGPINASPESFSRIRLKRGRVIGPVVLACEEGRARLYGPVVALPTNIAVVRSGQARASATHPLTMETAEILADARWFPLGYDERSDEFRFGWIPPETHRALTFISDFRPADLQWVSRAAAMGAQPPEAPLHIILHSGLGGSTLLARVLAQQGVVTPFKEPPILTDVVAFG